MTTNRARARVSLLLATTSIVALSCAGSPDDEGRIDAEAPPKGPVFLPVAQAVVEHCGSLDCHGSKYRNMRLFGFTSGRLDPTHRPDTPSSTLQAEADADYEAIVALEPDIMRQVVADRGANPERLTFVRKARGTEAHKGGKRIVPGDATDRCILSWLASNVDATVCKEAAIATR